MALIVILWWFCKQSCRVNWDACPGGVFTFLVEETGVPGGNHAPRPAASRLTDKTLSARAVRRRRIGKVRGQIPLRRPCPLPTLGRGIVPPTTSMDVYRIHTTIAARYHMAVSRGWCRARGAVADTGVGVGVGVITPPWTCRDTENLCKVCVTGTDHTPPPPPLGMWMTSHGQCPRGGGACECPRVGVFFKFPEGGWRHADNVQGGGVLVNNPVSAPGPPPFKNPAHTHAPTHADTPQRRIQKIRNRGGRNGGGGALDRIRY